MERNGKMKAIGVIVALAYFVVLSAGAITVVKAEETAAQAVEQMKTDLQNSGVASSDVRTAESSMKGLINSGVTPKEAGNVVSRSVKQAHAQGLKGKDLAAKVHEAVNERKDQMKAAKQKEKEARKKANEAAKNAQKKAKKAKEKMGK